MTLFQEKSHNILISSKVCNQWISKETRKKSMMNPNLKRLWMTSKSGREDSMTSPFVNGSGGLFPSTCPIFWPLLHFMVVYFLSFNYQKLISFYPQSGTACYLIVTGAWKEKEEKEEEMKNEWIVNNLEVC